MRKTRILICGISGKMGKNLVEIIEGDENAEVVCGVDLKPVEDKKIATYPSFNEVTTPCDVIIDFSSPAVLKDELKFAEAKKIPVVLAATGYTESDLNAIKEAAKKTAIFKTANFSLGVNLLVSLAKKAAAMLENFDVEIIEKHHNQKVDAPSGTALMFADAINSELGGDRQYLNGRCGKVGKRGSEIGIHAVRGGTIVGEHEIMFAGEDEVITLSHSAQSKKVFAAGALKAAKWICGKSAGLYDMNNIFNL